MPEKLNSNVTNSLENAIVPNMSSNVSSSDDQVICTCKNVTLGEIKAAIANGAKTVEAIQDKTSAGTGCGGCIGTLQDILDGKM